MIDEEIEIFSKAKKEKKSCPFCSDHWNTPARLFASEEEFKESGFYGGGDKVINDPHGVDIATWAGKHNVGSSKGELWLCVPAHPGCGCTWEEHSFKEKTKKEDWFSEMDWGKYEKSLLRQFTKSKAVYDYHCVMANVKDPEFIKDFESLQKKISTEDIYDDETNEFGLEKEPHVTILYGLTENNNIPEIEDYFQNIQPIQLKVSGLSLFECNDYDVLKFDINSKDLEAYNKYLTTNYEYETDYPEYIPHLTIAYLKKGTASKYLKSLELPKRELESKEIKFSLMNGLKFYVKTLDDSEFYKSTSGKVLREITIHGAHGDYQAKRWVKVEDEIEFLNDKQTIGEIELTTKTIFGKRITNGALAKLAGCFGKAKIRIEPIGRDTIKISVKTDNYISFSRVKIEIDKSKPSYGAKVIQLKKIRGVPKVTDSAKGKGTALNRVVTMIREGKKQGVKYITGDFIRTDKGHDGYFKYARLGFDGKINQNLAVEIKKNFPLFDYSQANTVQKFIKLYGLGKWGNVGGTFYGEFNLTNTNQMKILVKYIRSLKNANNH